MSVQYLIDYENVHESGLCGIKTLTAEDSVYIFHTSISDRIALNCLDDVQAWVKVIMVPAGKQSLDMHLGSFLGFLIGKEDSPDTQYVIVSKDSDYKGITEFWNHSYQKDDKVVCRCRILSSLYDENNISATLTAECFPAERIAIQDLIIRVFCKQGVIGLNGLPCMQVSELCTRLNALPEYNKARKRLAMKPMQFLREIFPDLLQVARQWSQDWVYLLGTQNFNLPARYAHLPARYAQENGTGNNEPEKTEPDFLEIADLTTDEGETIPETDTAAVDDNADTPATDPEDNGKELISPAAKERSIDDFIVEDMKLSVRTTNCLRRAGYFKTGEFIHLSDQELLKTRNLGQKGVDEIHRWVEKQSEAILQPTVKATPGETDGSIADVS